MDEITDVTLLLYTERDAEHFINCNQDKINSIEAVFLHNDISSLVHNVKTEKLVICYGKETLFATVNQKEYANTHLCSPFNNYIGYAKESAGNFNSFWIKHFILTLTRLLGNAFKLLKINKVVQINNPLTSINIHPESLTEMMPGLLGKITHRYPKHAILLSRFNLHTDMNLHISLKKNRFRIIPTKTVHIYDTSKNYMKRSHTKRDLSLFKKTEYRVIPHDELNQKDLTRIQKLYEMLFIKKHSARCNPILSIKYFQYCHTHRWFEFTGLRNKNGEIDAFITHARRNNLMICGPLGYDTSKPRKLGLYRMITSKNLDAAHQAGCVYNFGSGNERFKLNRGSIREIEYNAVYIEHLPFHRRIPWHILSWCGKHIAMRIFDKHLLN